MNSRNPSPRAVRFVSNEAPRLEQYAIADENGHVVYVYDAAFIRIFTEALGISYRILTPADGEFGEKLPDGNWTGMIGMITRSEADVAMDTVSLTEERYRDVSFIYPHVYSDLTFITDKPTFTRNQSVFSPFSIEVWLTFVGCMIAVSLLLFVSTGGKIPYQSVLFKTFGSFVEESIDIKRPSTATSMLVLAWVLGVMVLSQLYEAVLLSFLSIPVKVGIRNIAELSEAAGKNSIKCYTYKGSYLIPTLTTSEDESWKTIGECLDRNQNFTGDAEEAFFSDSSRKSFVTGRIFMYQYDNDFFLSRDSFFPVMYAIPISKDFCCEKRLNTLIHRLVAAGVFDKQLRDEYFVLQIMRTMKGEPYGFAESEMQHRIRLEELSRAFSILIIGWVSSFVVFLIEKVSNKRGP